MVIAGTAVDQRLDGEVRVTVIATGFGENIAPGRDAGAQSRRSDDSDCGGTAEEQPEFINLDTWNNLTRPGRQEDLFSESSDDDEQLGVPAILRQRRAAGKFF